MTYNERIEAIHHNSRFVPHQRRQLKRKLQEPTTNAHEVVVDGAQTSISKLFRLLVILKMFCAACTYYLTLPLAFTTEQKQAAVEVHMLYCCPRAHESILDDRRVKRNRLELTETGEMAQHLHSPGEIFFY
ncbi:unnamed protein product [Thelazia callipaeda]|uniref:Uncharacterized protein n=1 Tax=Thelazia callipaeda TaxID=103827 RepID=A0A0N5CT82_THECL|nr:unnamed protein product [Thelazia callipaeda]